MTTTDIARFIAAANFAALKHSTQRRKDAAATPYINHPIGVAHLLTSIGGIHDVAVLQAAVLHDTLEDTDTSIDELVREFGDTVTGFVLEVTMTPVDGKRMQIVDARTMSAHAQAIKLADKLYNVSDLIRATPVGWTLDRVQGYCVHAWAVAHAMPSPNAALLAALESVLSQVKVNGVPVPQLPQFDFEVVLESFLRACAAREPTPVAATVAPVEQADVPLYCRTCDACGKQCVGTGAIEVQVRDAYECEHCGVDWNSPAPMTYCTRSCMKRHCEWMLLPGERELRIHDECAGCGAEVCFDADVEVTSLSDLRNKVQT